MVAQLVKTEKFGATSYVTVEGVSEESVIRAGLRVKADSGVIKIAYTNKREYGMIIDIIDNENAKPARTVSVGKRKIALAANAAGESHGKSWVATMYDIDKNSLDPSWEGQLICYIYNA